jgi:hypothetical protein
VSEFIKNAIGMTGTGISQETAESLVHFGNAVKALGSGKVGGYLVVFSSESDPDLAGEFFTKNTDFVFPPAGAPITALYYDHGLDETLKRRVLGFGTMKINDTGVWVEGQLEMRDDYEKAIYQLCEAGKLGWSSGTAPHLVEKKTLKNATEITRWALGLDASLTATPCEPRTAALPLKSFKHRPLSELIDGEAGNKKGLYQQKLDKFSTPAIYDLTDALCSVFWQLSELQYVSDDTGTSIDIAAMWRDALAEFVLRATEAGNKYFASGDTSFFKNNTTGANGKLQASFPFALHSEAVRDAVKGFLERAQSLKKLRQTEGKTRIFNPERADKIKQIQADLTEAVKTFASLIAENGEQTGSAKPDLKKREQDLRLKALRIRAGISS